MKQTDLTIAVPIEGSEFISLRSLLAPIEDQVRGRRLGASRTTLSPFPELAAVHFAREEGGVAEFTAYHRERLERYSRAVAETGT